MEDMKVETELIANISANPIGRPLILVVIYVKTFKTDVIVFISDIIMCNITPTDYFHRPSHFTW
jgi:hypothetical protein